MRKTLLVLFLFSGMVCSGQDLIWPLKIEISPSSSFAEFRGLRFHGGVDLRTRQTTGFPVVAIADGYVSRMKIQHRGFGYALYVDHPGLKLRSVFGHLDDYAEPMASYASEKLKKIGKRYGIDDSFPEGRFPVKKGQVIAFSGETGIGPAHLHFELRRLNDDPVSPTLVGYRIPDSTVPTAYSLHVVPLGPDSRIDGGFLRKSIPLVKRSPNRYSWANLIITQGRVGLEIGIADLGPGGNRFGVESIELKVDGKTSFKRVFSEFSYDEMKQCPYVYDYEMSNMKGTGYVYNLFRWPFETLKFSPGFGPWAGTLGKQGPGEHALSIEARDFSGNTIVAEGSFRQEVSPSSKSLQVGDLRLRRIIPTAFSVVAEFETGTRKDLPGVTAGLADCLAGNGQECKLPACRTPNSYQLAIPISPGSQSGYRLNGTSFGEGLKYLDEKGGEVLAEKGVRVTFPKGALNLPALVSFNSVSTSEGKVVPTRTGSLIGKAPVWEMFPPNLLTDKSFEVEVPLPSSPDPRRLGFYEVNSTGYDFCGGEVKGGKISLASRTGGRFTILEDLSPPECGFEGKRSVKRMGKCLVYRVSDSGEGVAYGEVTATLDGKPVPADSDPDKGEVYVSFPPGKARRVVEIRVPDGAGNVREISEKR